MQNHNEIKEYIFSKWIDSERYADFVIELTDEEVLEAKQIGRRRFENNRKIKSYKSNWGNKKANAERDILGALSELATIKWLQENGYNPSKETFLTIDANAEEESFDTDIVFDGKTYSVEIKSTTKPMKAKLILPEHQANKDVKPDIIMLVCMIDEKRYCIKGVTNFSTVIQNFDKSLKNPGFSIEEKFLEKDILAVIEKVKQQQSKK